jgi:hypothetical protein
MTTSYIELLALKEGLFKLQNESQVTLSDHHQKITWIGQAQASPTHTLTKNLSLLLKTSS